ncbi:MAG: hypothetical protein M1818_007003 [Claussenomyces sp. TS43310]|nr:MAG: hypothetical protein M1818_007003 [Claussenomyces sp. TS43310]
MNEADAVTLLKEKLLENRFDNACITDLAPALDYLPLAITQATSYISQPRMTVPKYLGLLQKQEREVRVLRQNMADLRRDLHVPNAVIDTCIITFNRIGNSNPAAAELLSPMSLLDRQGIPQSLVMTGYQDEFDF